MYPPLLLLSALCFLAASALAQALALLEREREPPSSSSPPPQAHGPLRRRTDTASGTGSSDHDSEPPPPPHELSPADDAIFQRDFGGIFTPSYWRDSYFPRHPALLARLLGTQYRECVANVMDFVQKHGDVAVGRYSTVGYARALCQRAHPDDYQALFGMAAPAGRGGRQGVTATEPKPKPVKEAVVDNEPATRNRKKKQREITDDNQHSSAFSVVRPTLRHGLVRGVAEAAEWLRSVERSLAPAVANVRGGSRAAPRHGVEK
ncbi:MAG: hypothetical protein M1826_007664 [Phylliscum demangeonii]|nr:MAG: hypothetical protein M1826_007664 [Phylliscum demangeonii]